MHPNMARRSIGILAISTALLMPALAAAQDAVASSIPDTGVSAYYDDKMEISAPAPGQAYFGQDAHYRSNTPSYADNGDGTISDLVTGLMWQRSMGAKMTMQEARRKAGQADLGGHDDWRIPTVTELYSLILFTGQLRGPTPVKMFIDTRYFEQPLGDAARGERPFDAQTWSATGYAGRTMNNDRSIFGVNFVDGRVKAYPETDPRTRRPTRMYFRLVRGNVNYGDNSFVSNDDGTVTDRASGLMWAKDDSKAGMDWRSALAYCEAMQLAGFGDWRLPDAKELQTIVDYSRSPASTGSAALSDVFAISTIADPAGEVNYPHTWTSTTHLDGHAPGSGAVTICFGACQGRMRGRLVDAHGAGAQRSDPKAGDAADYPQYFGPQGDVRYVHNHARCVRGAAQ